MAVHYALLCHKLPKTLCFCALPDSSSENSSLEVGLFTHSWAIWLSAPELVWELNWELNCSSISGSIGTQLWLPWSRIFGFGSGSAALAPWEPFHYINPPNFFCVYISRFRQFQEIYFSQKFSKSMRWQRSTGTFCFSTTNVRLSEPELEMGAESRKFGSDRAGTGSRLLKQLRL